MSQRPIMALVGRNMHKESVRNTGGPNNGRLRAGIDRQRTVGVVFQRLVLVPSA